MNGFQAPTEHQDLARRTLAAVWHPCTQMQRAAAVPPVAILRGAGPWLFDETGRRYFDTSSSWWVNLFGHADARINAALKNQLDLLPHVISRAELEEVITWCGPSSAVS